MAWSNTRVKHKKLKRENKTKNRWAS